MDRDARHAAEMQMSEYRETFEEFPSTSPHFSVYFDVELHAFYLLNARGFDATVRLEDAMFHSKLADGTLIEDGYFFVVAQRAYDLWESAQNFG